MATETPPNTPNLTDAAAQPPPPPAGEPQVINLKSSATDPVTEIFWKEWSECRVTIGRLDTILVDLRKVGFSFITALLTASAFFGFTNGSGAPFTSTRPTAAQAAAGQVPVLLAIMTLIAILSAVDNYYEVLLSGAVGRALDLEARTSPAIRLTTAISDNAQKTGATVVTWLLYVFLFAAALGLAIFAADSANDAHAMGWVVGISLLLGALIVGNWVVSAVRVGLLRTKARQV